MFTSLRLLVVGIVACAACCLLPAPPSLGQTTILRTSPPTRVYRLGIESQYRHACFDPCDCSLDKRSPLDGTMILTRRATYTTGVRIFTVSDVNFRINVDGQEQLVRGGGTYTWTPSIGMLTVLGHRLELDLRVGDAAAQHFDSGLVPGSTVGEFPPINIIIDKNDQVCVDEVLTIAAAPVSEREIARYCLERPTNHIEGCFEPCLCPIFIQNNVTGTFALVRLPSRAPTGTVNGPVDYAVIRVNWTVGTGTSAKRITGSGFYSVVPPSLIEGKESMTLSLLTNGQDERVFRGVETLFTAPTIPPRRIDIAVSMNGMFCFDRVFDIASVLCPLATTVKSVDEPALDAILPK